MCMYKQGKFHLRDKNDLMRKYERAENNQCIFTIGRFQYFTMVNIDINNVYVEPPGYTPCFQFVQCSFDDG